MNAKTAKRPKYNVEDIRRRAHGQWMGIHPAVGGIDPQLLDGKNHPCPKCGGTDRFRFINRLLGVMFCNQCFNSKNGDGFAAIQWLLGVSFPESLRLVAEYLNAAPETDHKPAPAKKAPKVYPTVDDAARAAVRSVDGTDAGRSVYHDADGVDVLYIVRIDTPTPEGEKQRKQFRPISRHGDGWVMRAIDPAPLYRLREVMASTGTLFVCEGEKAANALRSIDLLATTSNGGARRAGKTDWSPVEGRHVVIFPDNDAPGKQYAETVKRLSLAAGAASVRIVNLPGLDEAGDAHDWLEARDAMSSEDLRAEIMRLVDESPLYDLPSTTEYNPEMPDDLDDSGDKWTSIRHEEGRTDYAFARRFLAANGDKVLYVPSWDCWFIWDGQRWTKDEGRCAILRMAGAISDSIWQETTNNRTEDTLDYAHEMSKPSRWKSVLAAVAAERAVSVDQLNTNQWLLNCPNGTVDLRTGEMREHRREDLITVLCPTEYDPHAWSEVFSRFIETVFPDPELAAFIRRLFGYAMTGRAAKAEEIFAILFGVGSNGKSVLMEILRRTLGNDFSGPATHGQLTEKANERHATETAQLYGKRLVMAAETGQGAVLDEALVKSLTGGEAVTARFLYKDLFTFDPTWTIFLSTNHRPRIRGNDPGIWRRVCLIPFVNRFWSEAKGETGPPELKADPGLRDKLLEARPAILAWLVAGALEWQSFGLAMPEAVKVATREYRTEEDIVGRFVAAECVRATGARVKFSELYAKLESWCAEVGERPPTKKRVGIWMRTEGFEDSDSHGRVYHGIGLLASDHNDHQ